MEKHNNIWNLLGSKSRYFVVTGGRGSGKSFEVGRFITLLSFEQGHKILFTRQTMTSAHLSIIPEFKDVEIGAHLHSTKEKANEKGHLFSKVPLDDVFKAIVEQTGIKIEKSWIKDFDQIKSVGDFDIKLEAFGEKAKILLNVSNR